MSIASPSPAQKLLTAEEFMLLSDPPAGLAIEVLSPSDGFSPVLRKVISYWKAGVRIVWLIDPEDRTLTVFRAPDRVCTLDENDTLSGEDVLPGFTCTVADLLR